MASSPFPAFSSKKFQSRELRTLYEAPEICSSAVRHRCWETNRWSRCWAVAFQRTSRPFKFIAGIKPEVACSSVAGYVDSDHNMFQPIICIKKFWTDLTVASHYIRNVKMHFGNSISNRSTNIQDRKMVENWRHVKLTDSPAKVCRSGTTNQHAMENTE